MPVLIRISFRNMWEHKAKSLIIGILVALGVVVIVLGNAMMDAADAGIRKTFTESYTGDLMIHGPSESVVSIFGVESMTMDADTEVPTIPDFDAVMEKVRADSKVTGATSMAVAYGLVAMDAEETIEDAASDGRENMIFGIIFGVDGETYFDLFPSVKLLQGRFLRAGAAEVLLTKNQMERLAKKYKRDFAVGDKVLINGFGTAGMRIRETEIVGVYEREGEASSPAPFIYTDIDTARVLGGLTLGTDASIVLDDTQTGLLAAADEDAIFGDDLFAEDMVEAAPSAMAKADFSDIGKLLGDTSARDLYNTADTGAWNFILVRLNNSADAPRAIAEYTAWFAEAGVDAKITDWKGAAGSFGKFADIVRVVFNIALLVIAVVAVIIMMNTLVISVIERTAEIGTMRALGAQRSYVRTMFLTETLTLTVIFGLIGSAVALLAVGILNALNIKAENELLKLLFGGELLRLVPRLGSFVSTIVMVFVVGYLAHLYPVAVALKIPPVAAMQSE
jgi:putative ABC transport system permease protein